MRVGFGLGCERFDLGSSIVRRKVHYVKLNLVDLSLHCLSVDAVF
jgi:hypothetical protein